MTAASQPQNAPPQDDRVPRRVFLYGMNYAPEPTGVGRFSGEIGAFLAQHWEAVEVVTTPPHYPGWRIKPPYVGGRYGVEITGRLRVNRCPIAVREEMRGFWRVLAPFSFAMFSAPVALWRALRTRPDILIAVEPTLMIAPAALLAAKLCGARSVLYVQDLELDAAFAMGHMRGKLLRRIGGAFERLLLKWFDHCITISGQMSLKLQEKGVAADRICVVRNWVNLELIRPLEGANPLRQEYAVPDNAFVVLYAGNVGAKQGLGVMLNAARALAEQPDILFVVAGDGPEKRRLQDAYGDLPNVRFWPLQSEDRLCALLNAADLHILPQDASAADLVLPSKLGGMLASGRPILVTANAGTELHDMLVDTAILVPAGDSDAVAAAVLEASQDTCRIDLRARAAVAALFDARTALPRLSDILRSL